MKRPTRVTRDLLCSQAWWHGHRTGRCTSSGIENLDQFIVEAVTLLFENDRTLAFEFYRRATVSMTGANSDNCDASYDPVKNLLEQQSPARERPIKFRKQGRRPM